MIITTNDLTKEISLEELIQLTDLNATGALNQEVLDDSINDAISFVNSFIDIPTNPTPLLKQIVVDLTICSLRKKNNFVSKECKERQKEIEGYLLKMANKKMPTSIEQSSSNNAPNMQNSTFAFKKKGKKLSTKGYLWQKNKE